MNKTTNIHLAKMSFSLDEKAYERLKKYLDDLNRLFETFEGREEIIEDIEMRIAELFTEGKTHKDQVIDFKAVEEVIETLGAPEDFVDETTMNENGKERVARKLYRDNDDRFIGGVAGGLSYYLGIDSIWIRLFLLFLVFSSVGGVIFVYILLWILVPEAVTTADKLKMRGEPVNVNTIKKKIKEELDQVSDSVKGVDYQNLSSNLKETSKSIFDGGGKILRVILRIIQFTIGVLLIFWSSLSLLALIIAVAVGTIFTTLIPAELLHLNTLYDVPFSGIVIVMSILIGIPFVFLFTLGIRLLSHHRKIMSRSTSLLLGGLWFLALLSVITFAVIESESQALTFEIRDQQIWEIDKIDTLQLHLNNPLEKVKNTTYFNDERIIETEEGKRLRLGNKIVLDIQQNSNDDIQLTSIKSANGWSKDKAKIRAQSIDHQIDFYNHMLLVDQYWKTPIENKRAGQTVKITLFLPENQYIMIDNDWTNYLQKNIANDQNYSRYSMAGHLWKMEGHQLICQDCKGFNGKASLDEDSFEMEVNKEGVNQSIHVNLDENGLTISTEKKEDQKP